MTYVTEEERDMTSVEAAVVWRQVTLAVVVWFVTIVVSVAALGVFVPTKRSEPDVPVPSTPTSAPVSLVECFEDLSCSDRSTLDTWDCARSTFIDIRGRLVHSNGVCGGNPPGDWWVYLDTVQVGPDGSLPTYQDWPRGEGR